MWNARFIVSVSIAPLLGTLAFGCATGSDGRGSIRGTKFPSREAVKRIENTTPPAEVFDADLRHVNEWALEVEAPRRIEARRWVDRSDWGEVLDDAAKETGGRVTPTQAMHCVASELARFTLVHGGQPDYSLRRFIVAGCNASVPDVSYRLLRGEVDVSDDDDEIFERWRDSLLPMARTATRTGKRSVVGIGFARQGERAAVYIVTGEPAVEIEAIDPRLGQNQPLVLRGRVLGAAESVYVAINIGIYEYDGCETVGNVQPPAFHFVCEPDPRDESTWAAISFTRPNRVLGERGLNVLVWPQGRGDRVYRRAEYTGSRIIDEAERFAPAFLDDLNGVRKRAGMRPVTLDAAQSATATRVAPHFFAAMVEGASDAAADQAALGLMAGWDVDGVIRTGRFSSGVVPQTHDLAVLLGVTLEDPLARGALLDPGIEKLAVGPIVGFAGEMPVLAAVVTSYSLFHAGSERSDADILLARLAEERHKQELPPPYRLIEVSMDAMHAAGEVSRGETAQNAIDDLLQTAVNSLSRKVRGWYGETSELEAFQFPDELLSTPKLGTAIGVAHLKDPDQAWGRYVVMIVSVTD